MFKMFYQAEWVPFYVSLYIVDTDMGQNSENQVELYKQEMSWYFSCSQCEKGKEKAILVKVNGISHTFEWIYDASFFSSFNFKVAVEVEM